MILPSLATAFKPLLAVATMAVSMVATGPAIQRPGSYTISALAGGHSSRARPNDPAASFVCPGANDPHYSNECAQLVVGIAPSLNCFFTDTVLPVRSHDGNYFGVAGMQVIGWPYDNVSNAPVRLWYVYWLNIFNQPLTGYGSDRKLYAIATCV